ncbi:MAG: glycosyltransferase family 2 protein [Acidaminococcaceae bacterium]|nr:glycosyltransferase family 2 protein [Acidaminococcaceae bacterium]
MKRECEVNNVCVIILTKNEEKNIVGAVQNAWLVADEVLIVDSGSTDKTCEEARKNGAEVVYRQWDNDFAAQRNFGLTQTDAEWVLYLDADERMNEKLAAAVKKVIAEGKDAQYSFMRKSVAFGKEFSYGVLHPDRVLRLFRRTSVHWVNKVHERPVCSLPSCKLDGYAMHYTYENWQQYYQKFNQYTTIWAENAFSKGKRTGYLSAFAHGLFAFIQTAFLKKGLLDGFPGLVLSLNHSFYTLVKYVKLIELQRISKE